MQKLFSLVLGTRDTCYFFVKTANLFRSTPCFFRWSSERQNFRVQNSIFDRDWNIEGQSKQFVNFASFFAQKPFSLPIRRGGCLLLLCEYCNFSSSNPLHFSAGVAKGKKFLVQKSFSLPIRSEGKFFSCKPSIFSAGVLERKNYWLKRRFRWY